METNLTTVINSRCKVKKDQDQPKKEERNNHKFEVGMKFIGKKK